MTPQIRRLIVESKLDLNETIETMDDKLSVVIRLELQNTIAKLVDAQRLITFEEAKQSAQSRRNI